MLQQPLQVLAGATTTELIRRALEADDLEDANPLLLEINAQRFNGSLNRHDGMLMLEVEPVQDAIQDNSAILLRALRRMQAATTLDALYSVSVDEIRRLTGFDRVMIYRFQPAGHGQVLSESLGGNLPGYLGQCFPASDIPAQARELYRLNWIRVIPDAHYVPVPIVPLLRPDTGQPLDLGFSVLRSVLPVHCQYLENMGVRAAMSLSLLEDEQLWGLITYAHPEPLLVIHTKATRMVAAWVCISVAASCRPTVVSFGRKANPEREACLPFPSPHWQRRSGSSL